MSAFDSIWNSSKNPPEKSPSNSNNSSSKVEQIVENTNFESENSPIFENFEAVENSDIESFGNFKISNFGNNFHSNQVLEDSDLEDGNLKDNGDKLLSVFSSNLVESGEFLETNGCFLKDGFAKDDFVKDDFMKDEQIHQETANFHSGTSYQNGITNFLENDNFSENGDCFLENKIDFLENGNFSENVVGEIGIFSDSVHSVNFGNEKSETSPKASVSVKTKDLASLSLSDLIDQTTKVTKPSNSPPDSQRRDSIPNQSGMENSLINGMNDCVGVIGKKIAYKGHENKNNGHSLEKYKASGVKNASDGALNGAIGSIKGHFQANFDKSKIPPSPRTQRANNFRTENTSKKHEQGENFQSLAYDETEEDTMLEKSSGFIELETLRKEATENYGKIKAQIDEEFATCFSYLDKVKGRLYEQNEGFYNAQLEKIDANLKKSESDQKTKRPNKKRSLFSPTKIPQILSNQPQTSIFGNSLEYPNFGSIWDSVPNNQNNSQHIQEKDSIASDPAIKQAIFSDKTSQIWSPPARSLDLKGGEESLFANSGDVGQSLFGKVHEIKNSIFHRDEFCQNLNSAFPGLSNGTIGQNKMQNGNSKWKDTKNIEFPSGLQNFNQNFDTNTTQNNFRSPKTKKAAPIDLPNRPSQDDNSQDETPDQEPQKFTSSWSHALTHGAKPANGSKFVRPVATVAAKKHFNWLLGILSLFSNKQNLDSEPYLREVMQRYEINVNTKDTTVFEIVPEKYEAPSKSGNSANSGNNIQPMKFAQKAAQKAKNTTNTNSRFYRVYLITKNKRRISIGRTKTWLDKLPVPIFGHTVRSFMECLGNEFGIDLDKFEHVSKNMLLSKINTIFQLTARWEFSNAATSLTSAMTAEAIGELADNLVRHSGGNLKGLESEIEKHGGEKYEKLVRDGSFFKERKEFGVLLDNNWAGNSVENVIGNEVSNGAGIIGFDPENSKSGFKNPENSIQNPKLPTANTFIPLTPEKSSKITHNPPNFNKAQDSPKPPKTETKLSDLPGAGTDRPLRFYVKVPEAGLDYISFKNYFSNFGNLKDCYLAERFNQGTNRHEARGFGFVEFYKFKHAISCWEQKVHRIKCGNAPVAGYVVFLNKAFEKMGDGNDENGVSLSDKSLDKITEHMKNGEVPQFMDNFVKIEKPEKKQEQKSDSKLIKIERDGTEKPPLAISNLPISLGPQEKSVLTSFFKKHVENHQQLGYFNWILAPLFLFSKQFNQTLPKTSLTTIILQKIVKTAVQTNFGWALELKGINNSMQFDFVEVFSTKKGYKTGKNDGQSRNEGAGDPVTSEKQDSVSSGRHTVPGFRIMARYKNNMYELGEAALFVPKIVPLKDYCYFEFASVLNKHCGESFGAKSGSSIWPKVEPQVKIGGTVRPNVMSSSMSQAMKKQLVRDLYAKLGKLSGGFEQKLVMKVLGSEIINVSGQVIDWSKTNVGLNRRDRNSKSESLNQKSEPILDSKSDSKSARKSVRVLNRKSDSKSDSKSDQNSDSKTEQKTDSNPESKTNLKSDSKTEPKSLIHTKTNFPNTDLNLDSLPSLNKFDELIQKIQNAGTTELESDWECSTNFESLENEGKKVGRNIFDDESSISDSLSGNDMRQKVCSSSDEELRAGRHYEDELDAECELLESERLEYDGENGINNGSENKGFENNGESRVLNNGYINKGSNESCGYPRGSSDEDVTETGNDQYMNLTENTSLDTTMSNNDHDSKNSIVSDVKVGNRFTHLLGSVGTD